MLKFQEVCGNRTELCHLCNRYIRLRERVAHEVTCNGVPAEIPRFKEQFLSSFPFSWENCENVMSFGHFSILGNMVSFPLLKIF